jgi:putative transposase
VAVRGERTYRPVRVEGFEPRVRAVLQGLERRAEGRLSEVQEERRTRLGSHLRGDARGAAPANPEHWPCPVEGEPVAAWLRWPILSATITRRANRWFVSLAVQREREIALPREATKSTLIVGVDLGLKSASVIHDGAETRVVEPQRALRRNLQRLRRINRQLARKQRGSANREKAKRELARLYYKISCQRRDQLHQLSSSLAKTKSVIVLEDLHVKGMQRNKHLALSVSDAGMGELRRQLAYKSEWYGSTLVVADRFFPSSKLCSGCGTIKDTLALGERVYCCDVCGLSLGRDENAAINLRRLALAQLPEGLGEVTPVERKALTLAPGERETGLVETGSDSERHSPFDSQKHAERRAGTDLNRD